MIHRAGDRESIHTDREEEETPFMHRYRQRHCSHSGRTDTGILHTEGVEMRTLFRERGTLHIGRRDKGTISTGQHSHTVRQDKR